MAAPAPVLVLPRWGTRRNLDYPTRGNLDAQVADLLGWSYFGWQRLVSDVAGEYDPTTRLPRYRTVGVSVARQNGKTTLVLSRIARQLIVPHQNVAYTAQDRTVAFAKWQEHVEALMGTPFAERVERIEKVSHRETLVMHNGSRYAPVTPTGKKAGRSLSIDLAVIDEAHAHGSLDVIGALGPTMATRAHAQLWLLSNAGDDESVLWKHYTNMGRQEVDKPESTMAWFEWAPAPDIDVMDRDAWAQANPSLGQPGGVLESAILDGATTMSADTFRREHLNLWVDGADMAAIDPIAWAACRDDTVQIGRQFIIALDFTPERDRGGLTAVGKVGDRYAIEVLEHSTDLAFLLGRTLEIAKKWRVPVAVDRSGPAASAIPILERNKVDVRKFTGSDLAAAAGVFHDYAVAGLLAHRGDYRLNDAIGLATRRPVGDRWTWARRGPGDICLLGSVTLALWAVLAAPVQPRVGVF